MTTGKPLPSLGQKASLTRTISDEDIRLFAELSSDHNPMHLDDEYAAQTIFGRRIAHGMLSASLISSVLGNDLPGPGAVYLGQTLKFLAPVYIGDTITATVEVSAIREDKRIVTLYTECAKSDGTIVITGEATIKCL